MDKSLRNGLIICAVVIILALVANGIWAADVRG
jgi:hypothetical protein